MNNTNALLCAVYFIYIYLFNQPLTAIWLIIAFYFADILTFKNIIFWGYAR
jgi:hypothetical protein